MSTPPPPLSMRTELGALIRLTLPIMVSSMLGFLMSIVDLWYVGHLGTHELAAAAVGNLFFNTLQHPVFGCATALDTLLAQAYGASQLEAYGIHTQTGLFALLAMCLPYVAILLAAEPILLMVRVEPALAKSAAEFCIHLAPGVPPYFVFTALTKFLQAQSILLPSVAIGFAANLLNALGNYLLIHPMGLGFRGAPVATSISRWVQCALLCAYLVARRRKLAPTLPPRRVAWRQLPSRSKHFLRLGAPGALMMGLEAWFFEVSTLLASFLGTVALDAHVVMLNVCAFTFLAFPFAVGIAASIRVGHTLGANQPAIASTTARVTFVLILTFMSSLAVVKVACRHVIGLIFSSDPEVVSTVASIVFIAALFQISDGVQAACAGVLRGMGRQSTVAWLNLVGFWVLGLPIGASLTFGAGLGLDGLWWGMAVGLTSTAVAGAATLSRTDWQLEATKARRRSEACQPSQPSSTKAPPPPPSTAASDAGADAARETPSTEMTIAAAAAATDDGVRAAHALP